MFFKIRKILLALSFSFVVVFSYPTERQFNWISMAEGLSNNAALCLLEDHNGFIWIGTQDGLNKYDGINFHVYKHIFFDSTSLVNNEVICLFETLNHEIWVGTANGLCKYKPKINKFKTFALSDGTQPFDSYYIRTIFESQDGKVWVGTTNGVYKIDEKDENVQFLLIQPELDHSANNVRKIFQDSKGTVWFGTTNGLYKKSDERFESVSLEKEMDNNPQTIREIVESENGDLWIGTEGNGVYVLDALTGNSEVKFKMNTSNFLLPSNTVRSIYFEDDQKVWIGTFGGLSIFNSATNESTNYSSSDQTPGSISNNSIRDIIRDSQGGFWVAIYAGGVNYYHPQKNMFHHRLWQSVSGQQKNNVISVLVEDDQKNLWIGSEGGGVYRSTDEGITIAENLVFSDIELTENTVKSMALFKNKLWIGTLTGLNDFDLNTRKIEKHKFDPGKNNSLNSGHVLALLNENNEKLWVGTNGGGVQIYEPETASFKTIQQLENHHVRCFYQDSENRIWIGCEEGIYLYENDREINLENEIEQWKNDISDLTFITEDSQHNYWIGTRGMGLYLIKNKKLFWFNTSNGLIDNTVNSLLEGKKNEYWITTNKGLSKIVVEFDETEKVILSSETFSLNQGVQGLQFSPNCAIKTSNGNLVFGGLNGLNVFNPVEIFDNAISPKLVFSDLKINYKIMQPGDEKSPLTKSLNETDALILKYNQRDFSIAFAGINFINPDKNIYRYKVVGIDDSWIEMGSESNINFTYFPVGTYEIRLQVTTNPNNWGSGYRALQVTILPPIWKTGWAFLIYALILIAMLIMFFILTQRWAKMKNQLEMQQFQREKEKELHQLKLKFFTDVSHELRTPLTLILAPLENLISKSDVPNRIRNQLLQIQRSGHRLMQLVNQILDLRKLETGHEQLRVAQGNIIRFLSEISLAFKEVAAAKNISFDFIAHKESMLKWYDRDKLEIILNNLLSNAIKFTPDGGHVQLEIKEIYGNEINAQDVELNANENYVQLQVVDSGGGIRTEDLSRIYKRFYSTSEKNNPLSPNSGVGLELTKRMVELHKGIIKVESVQKDEQNNFTVFSVYIPMEKQAYSDKEINLDFKNSEDPSLYTQEFLQRESLMELSTDHTIENVQHNSEQFERLLIVEDNPEVREFIKELFSDEYEISEAENGKVAFEKAIETNPQLIISDIMMPVMNGIELCRHIKTDARTSHIPVILLTARTAVTFKYEGLETGADDYITKPFSSKFLSLRVKNLIQQRKTIQEHFRRETICDPGNFTVTSVDEKILKKAVDYISSNIADSTINVNKISAHVGLSRVHFYRKIKALTNQTPVEFIRNIKLKRAADLLSQKKLSVKEVRNMVGFEDADYFRECFKNQFGVSPSEYSPKQT